MIRVKETLIRHASDVIRWLDATGRADRQLPVLNPLQIELDEDLAVQGLRLLHKPGCSIVWRRRPANDAPLGYTVDTGRASEEQKQRPVETPYQLKGSVRDPAGFFNPRRFQQSCGGNTYPEISLYRSPAGTRLSQGKSLQGILQFRQQVGEAAPAPASWALVSLLVDIASTGDTYVFNAQADVHGYFQIPVTRLSSAMLNGGLAATFSVKADKAQSGSDFPDPDQMSAKAVALPGDANFTATLDVVAQEKNNRLKLGFVADEARVTTLELQSS